MFQFIFFVTGVLGALRTPTAPTTPKHLAVLPARDTPDRPAIVTDPPVHPLQSAIEHRNLTEMRVAAKAKAHELMTKAHSLYTSIPSLLHKSLDAVQDALQTVEKKRASAMAVAGHMAKRAAVEMESVRNDTKAAMVSWADGAKHNYESTLIHLQHRARLAAHQMKHAIKAAWETLTDKVAGKGSFLELVNNADDTSETEAEVALNRVNKELKEINDRARKALAIPVPLAVESEQSASEGNSFPSSFAELGPGFVEPESLMQMGSKMTAQSQMYAKMEARAKARARMFLEEAMNSDEVKRRKEETERDFAKVQAQMDAHNEQQQEMLRKMGEDASRDAGAASFAETDASASAFAGSMEGMTVQDMQIMADRNYAKSQQEMHAKLANMHQQTLNLKAWAAEQDRELAEARHTAELERQKAAMQGVN